jgi:hypothetical protein
VLQHGTGVEASRNVVTGNIWGAVQVPDGSLLEAAPLLDLFLVAALAVDLIIKSYGDLGRWYHRMRSEIGLSRICYVCLHDSCLTALASRVWNSP